MIGRICLLAKPERVVVVLVGNGFLRRPIVEPRFWKSIDVS